MKSDRHPDSAEQATLAQALFSPQRIALVGASENPAHLASRPLRVLRRHGYRGSILPVNPALSRVSGVACHASLSAIPGGAEHALIMTPAVSVTATIAECAAAGVRVATVLTSGYAELGPSGRRRQEALVAAGRRAGVRILGPNSLGIVNVTARTALSANAVFEYEELRPGGTSVVSQSGSMLGAIVTRAQERGIGFSKLVSIGNECDLGVGELVEMLVDDADTTAILLFLEALHDAPRLAAAARRAYASGKPVIVYKLGRSEASRELAVTHTGATLGTDAATNAFFRDHGMLRTRTFEALFEMPNLVIGHRPRARLRLGTVTVSGGAAAMVLDNLRGAPVEVAPPPATMLQTLAQRRIRVGGAPVIDLPMGRADQGAYAAVLKALLASPHCDIVLAVQGSNAAYLPESVEERIIAAGPPGKPLAVFIGPRADEASRMLQARGIATFRTPESCADAIRAYAEWCEPLLLPTTTTDDAEAVRAAIRNAGTGTLNEAASHRVLDALGIPCAPMRVVKSGNEAVGLDFPVAAKLLATGIPHKREVDGVVLDIATADQLAAQVDRLLARAAAEWPDVDLDGVLVQTMQYGIAEVLVAFRRDPEAGPVVVLGWGDDHDERSDVRVVRTAPLSLAEARAMICELPGHAEVHARRGLGKADKEAIAATIRSLSLLALADAAFVLEAEINPLIVKTRGAVAVDALVRLGAQP